MSKESVQFAELVKQVAQRVDKRFVYFCPKCKKHTWHVLRALDGRRFDMCGECGVFSDPPKADKG